MINKVTLIGRTGAAPELKRLDNGTAVARLSLATSRGWKDQDGNWQNETDWHNVIMWRDLAERAEKSLAKGNLVYVEGEIKYRRYKDAEGKDRFVTDIVAKKYRKLEKSEAAPLMPTQEFPTQAQPVGEGEKIEDEEDGDLPF